MYFGRPSLFEARTQTVFDDTRALCKIFFSGEDLHELNFSVDVVGVKNEVFVCFVCFEHESLSPFSPLTFKTVGTLPSSLFTIIHTQLLCIICKGTKASE